jgi:hypothetical protein
MRAIRQAQLAEELAHPVAQERRERRYLVDLPHSLARRWRVHSVAVVVAAAPGAVGRMRISQ